MAAPELPRLDTTGARLASAIALIASDPPAARRKLESLRAEQPLLDDVASYYIARALGKTDPKAEAERLWQLLEQHQRSPVLPPAFQRLTELLEADENTDGLERLSKLAAERLGRREEAAGVELAAGRLRMAEDPAAASAHLTRARQLAPGGATADRAAQLLIKLRHSHPQMAPTSTDELWEDCDLARHESSRTREMSCLDVFLARYPNSPRAITARLRRGRALSKSQGRSAAAAWFEKAATEVVSAKDKARLLFAAAAEHWNANESTVARSLFETVLTMATGIDEEQRAYFALGRIHERAKRFNGAASAYRHGSTGRDVKLAHECAWRAAWVSYLAGNFEGAAWAFGSAAERARDYHDLDGGYESAIYWQARSLERSGKSDEALGLFRLLLEKSPDGYYTMLAEQRTGLAAAPPTVERLADDPAADFPMRRVLARSATFREADLIDFAVQEMETGLREASVEVRRSVLPRLLDLGMFSTALRSALDLYQRKAIRESQLYPYLYPHAFAEVIARETSARSLDPFLVYSLIRQESAFDHRAVSRADAVGLMQLLLPTARRVAAAIGAGATIERRDLFVPETNIRLGTAYLGQLSQRFRGNRILMLAGYNAGERAAERWQQRLQGRAQDEFVELISYRETRGYVKKILRNLRNYRRLYAQPQPLDSIERVEKSAR